MAFVNAFLERIQRSSEKKEMHVAESATGTFAWSIQFFPCQSLGLNLRIFYHVLIAELAQAVGKRAVHIPAGPRLHQHVANGLVTRLFSPVPLGSTLT